MRMVSEEPRAAGQRSPAQGSRAAETSGDMEFAAETVRLPACH